MQRVLLQGDTQTRRSTHTQTGVEWRLPTALGTAPPRGSWRPVLSVVWDSLKGFTSASRQMKPVPPLEYGTSRTRAASETGPRIGGGDCGRAACGVGEKFRTDCRMFRYSPFPRSVPRAAAPGGPPEGTPPSCDFTSLSAAYGGSLLHSASPLFIFHFYIENRHLCEKKNF